MMQRLIHLDAAVLRRVTAVSTWLQRELDVYPSTLLLVLGLLAVTVDLSSEEPAYALWSLAMYTYWIASARKAEQLRWVHPVPGVLTLTFSVVFHGIVVDGWIDFGVGDGLLSEAINRCILCLSWWVLRTPAIPPEDRKPKMDALPEPV